MAKRILFLFTILFSLQLFANVNHIDLTKISTDMQLVKDFNYIKENKTYYDHWNAEWNYTVKKSTYIQELERCYQRFAALSDKKVELYLLLGDIAHYLYNLDDSAYFKVAESNYNLAIKNNPNEFRAYWFAGNHYALSNLPNKSIYHFKLAQQFLPNPEPADYWEEYALAAILCNMPSHALFAMDRSKELTGIIGSVELQMGSIVRNRIVKMDRDQTYKREEIWYANEGDKITFTSRPLGMKLKVDSNWKVEVYDYKDRQGVFIIKPTSIANKKGLKIDYTIALLMKVANDKDQLSSYIDVFTKKYSNKVAIQKFDKYDRTIAYEILDKNMYPNVGGGHLYIIGIERPMPKYPGIQLEVPIDLPSGNEGVLTYYQASDSKGRFEGKIFYAILLDTCEDIHAASLEVFTKLFEKELVIE